MKIGVWRRLGPGFLLAATSVGASHLVLSPQAGALFGYQLLWLVVACHLLKYPTFDIGPRYAAATGRNLLQGYSDVPGPRAWPLWIFLAGTVLQGVGVLAGVVSISGCVLHSWTGILSLEIHSVVLLAFVVALLFAGGFKWLDNLNKIMMLILAGATVLAFFSSPPPLSAFAGVVKPWIPAGSIVLVAAFLGWMPTGVDVSVWHSFWTLEKLRHLGEKAGSDEKGARLRHLKLSLFDMRVGYGLSLISGLMFVCLGAVHLSGRGSELKGIQFAEAISTAYTAILGGWMYNVFMLTAFFAMFSTSYTVIDGFSRSFSEALSELRPRWNNEQTRQRTYFGFVIASAVFAAVTLITVGNPVALVTIVALISLTIAPILYGLNLYCVRRHINDPSLCPASWTIALGWLGVILMIVALGVTFYAKVLR
ncbi:MAG: divalent metal cation transporter [Proteobacteria bacterium]|nr:divalent metal cation transporter [Pseudomonadota bacterium]